MVKAYCTVIHSKSYHSVASFKPEQTESISYFLRNKGAILNTEEAWQAAKWCKTACVGQVLAGPAWEIEIDDDLKYEGGE